VQNFETHFEARKRTSVFQDINALYVLFYLRKNYRLRCFLDEEERKAAKTPARTINFSRMLISKHAFNSFSLHFPKRAGRSLFLPFFPRDTRRINTAQFQPRQFEISRLSIARSSKYGISNLNEQTTWCSRVARLNSRRSLVYLERGPS